ncbi:MAG: hypothetical protein R3D98_09110 [Candidatus Krumholzibacteriia bacterium]
MPWATLAPAPLLRAWLDRNRPTGAGQTALVVGCGLGDDAAEMARRGFAVTAFDVAASAIALARERHLDLAIDWQVAELFATRRLVARLRGRGRAPYHPVAAAGLAGARAAGRRRVPRARRHLDPGGRPAPGRRAQDGPPWRLRPEELAPSPRQDSRSSTSRAQAVAHAPGRTRLLRVYQRGLAADGST